jgi:hypothetical protein
MVAESDWIDACGAVITQPKEPTPRSASQQRRESREPDHQFGVKHVHHGRIVLQAILAAQGWVILKES